MTPSTETRQLIRRVLGESIAERTAGRNYVTEKSRPRSEFVRRIVGEPQKTFLVTRQSGTELEFWTGAEWTTKREAAKKFDTLELGAREAERLVYSTKMSVMAVDGEWQDTSATV